MTETEPPKYDNTRLINGAVLIITGAIFIVMVISVDKINMEFAQIDQNFARLDGRNIALENRITEIETIANESDSVTLPGTNGMLLTRGINNGTHLLKFVEFFSCRNLNHTINCIRNSATETVVQENKELGILNGEI